MADLFFLHCNCRPFSLYNAFDLLQNHTLSITNTLLSLLQPPPPPFHHHHNVTLLFYHLSQRATQLKTPPLCLWGQFPPPSFPFTALWFQLLG
ncbi:hypothetical protein VNO78_07288 [Psophocarpus tetragonolobus]|uniref:Uncharacterized protein n=1 Tax=Psophocarpus tetragonolobus TaxID=3891 RepID=A0AAN9XRZ1_PSOTE